MEYIYEQDGSIWRADPERAIDASIRQSFGSEQPNAFGLDDAVESPVDAPGFSGDIHRGASCNCRRIELIPHANGTHTETVCHLTDSEISPAECVPPSVMPAIVATVETVQFGESDDSYDGRSESEDEVIEAAALHSAAGRLRSFLSADVDSALLVKVADLDVDLSTRQWSGTHPPYFTDQAINWLIDADVNHLATELPSIDREDDGGSLPNHRRWWGLPTSDSNDVHDTSETSRRKTITEMMDVPERCTDGRYLLELQVPPLQTDAVPSRPLLYPVIESPD